eukprot:g21862.t1
MNSTNPASVSNPLLALDGLPRFDEIKPEHVVPAVQEVVSTATKRLEELESGIQPTWEDSVEALDEIGRPFEYAWGPVSHLFGVLNSNGLREAYEKVLPEVVTFSLRVKQSEPIFRALTELRDGPEWDALSACRKRIVTQKIQSAELSGIGLPEEQRERFNEIAKKLSQLSTEFSNHVLDATKAYFLDLTDPADVEGMPESLLQLASQSYRAAASPWRITLDAPCVGPFLQHCRNRELREQVYRAYLTRASSGETDNSEILHEILRLRKERAELLGYRSHAEVSLAEKMAPDVAAVESMFETLRDASWQPALQDMDDLAELRKAAGDSAEVDSEIRHWDVSFWAERLREKEFEFTDEQLRPYFSLERVLNGLFSLASRLFGISVKRADGDAPLWHPDVQFFKVHDEADGSHLASFYLDPYSRPENKRGGAWMDECLVRRRSADRLQLPVAHLVCNSTPPVGDKPSLMTFREVETLFHEFGHGLQQMLTTVDEADASGINGVEWDAVELPSQFMENWCYHKPTLLGMTAHYETGEPLPEDLFNKLVAARTFRSGSQMLRQLQFGMIDMELHSTFDPDGTETAFDVQKRIAEKTSVLPMLPEDRSLCAFQHIFSGGYAAGYYSYKWAEVLSADAFAAFEEAGLDDEAAIAETGRRFRSTVLSQGGGRHPMEVFREFRGREPEPEPLLRHSGLI